MARSIVISADYKVSQYLEVLLKSIFLSENNRADLTIYLLNYDYPRDLIVHYLKQCQLHLKHCKLKVLTPSKGHKRLLQNLNLVSDTYSKSLYYKLFLAELLPEEESVVSFDPYTLVLQDLGELLDYPIDPNVSIYACRDHLLSRELENLCVSSNSYYLNKFKAKLDQEMVFWRQNDVLNEQSLVIQAQETKATPAKATTYNGKYDLFSTEVMILNLKKIREEKIFYKYLAYLSSNEVVTTPHVNIFLNLLHRYDWQALPDKFNYQVDYINKEVFMLEQAGYKLRTYQELASKLSYNLPSIVSFTGVYKPLNSNKKMPFRRLFIELYNESISELLLNRNVFNSKEFINKFTYIHLLRLDDQGWYQHDLSQIHPYVEQVQITH
ncbi:glycosyltransferase [Psittacicella hinzii]|uniref:Uncharacterized protein n=1 Tax=Psittacicella hinzii TaxID=2028575 RepID=A0A3A1YJW4_9GAMM|nr:glycosyltransferase [Psittacicella hinzii]RIY37955.1 hypothetical protein CKF58_04410 [Psittacicella hinzii]